MATSGSGPASASAMAKATGSLSICTLPSTSPSAFMRTITDRRRCRSMPTYCLCTTGPPRLEVRLVLPPRVLARSGVPESGRTLFLLAATATLAIATPNSITADGGRAAPRQPSHGITSRSGSGDLSASDSLAGCCLTHRMAGRRRAQGHERMSRRRYLGQGGNAMDDDSDHRGTVVLRGVEHYVAPNRHHLHGHSHAERRPAT